MQPITGAIRHYAWGSRRVIAAYQGRPVPSPEPEAELWFGTHPSAPSTVEGGGPVPGPLPYLLKLLAAAEPLSLQAHPDAARARERFAAGDPNYTDPAAKPELLVAVDEFEALCGFADPARTAGRLRRWGVLPALVDVLDRSADPLRDAVALLLDWPAADRAAAVASVAAADPLSARLAADYPDDPGVLVALLLNHVRLAAGQAIFMPAGNLHCYLRGTGIEIMAASDNVLRGGLTPKRVDVPELLAVLRYEVLADPVVAPVNVSPGVVTWPVPVPDFALHRATVDGRPVPLDVPDASIALCLVGEVTVDTLRLTHGHAAYGRPRTVAGHGTVYVASPGT